MKSLSWMKLAGINLLFVAMVIFPFLPGPPNKFVMALSAFGHVNGIFGLLLVPVAMIWIVVEIKKRRRRNNESPNWKLSLALAIISTIIITAIYFLATLLGLFVGIGLLAGIFGLLAGAIILMRVIREIRKLRDTGDRQFNPVPFYLLTIPLITFAAEFYLVRPVSDYSRNFAIQRGQVLITAIEDYKNKEGHYPESVHDLKTRYLKKIPSPFIMGILDYRYNKFDNHYSISFSQWLDFGSLEEIVLYDRNNLHSRINAFKSYDYSVDLHRVNGAFAVHDTKYDNWRSYHCD